MERIVIDNAKQIDAEAIAQLLAVTWLDTYPNEELGITEADIRTRTLGEHGERIPKNISRWRNNIKSSGKNNVIYVARTGKQVVGLVSARIDINHHNLRSITALYVSPSLQGHGLGTQLMHKVLNWLGDKHDIYVIVASYNTKAINFYKHFGFRETGKTAEDTSARESGDKEIPEIEMILERDKIGR